MRGKRTPCHTLYRLPVHNFGRVDDYLGTTFLRCAFSKPCTVSDFQHPANRRTWVSVKRLVQPRARVNNEARGSENEGGIIDGGGRRNNQSQGHLSRRVQMSARRDASGRKSFSGEGSSPISDSLADSVILCLSEDLHTQDPSVERGVDNAPTEQILTTGHQIYL